MFCDYTRLCCNCIPIPLCILMLRKNLSNNLNLNLIYSLIFVMAYWNWFIIISNFFNKSYFSWGLIQMQVIDDARWYCYLLSDFSSSDILCSGGKNISSIRQEFRCTSDLKRDRPRVNTRIFVWIEKKTYLPDDLILLNFLLMTL